ncbi:MAG: adenylate/guanylate cyclase domain-containing protein [Verrucomicrobia bacterium]|nr:adenylate/guanylate cyclase domain-containing protein [Verrucomicrobiota bacterium]
MARQVRAEIQPPDGGAVGTIGRRVHRRTKSQADELAEARQLSLAWPRKLYALLTEELVAEGAKLIGLDVFFIDQAQDCVSDRMKLPDGAEVSSDAYFAYQLRAASNVVLAAPIDTEAVGALALAYPLELFRTNALAVGHDGLRQFNPDPIFRRSPAFLDDPKHGPTWHMGIVLAARALGLDLSKAVVESDRIILRGPGGLTRVIPVDRDKCFYIDWRIPAFETDLLEVRFSEVWEVLEARKSGLPIGNHWQDRIVIVGSAGTGNNISDWGATPLSKSTLVFSSHWNVVDAVLNDRFIRRAPYGVELGLIVLLAVAAALLSWRLRALWASLGVLLLAVLYVWACVWLYVQQRLWVPLVLPLAGALLMTHVCMVAYRMVVERVQQRLFKSALGRVVSPNVFSLIAQMEPRSLAGSRWVTIYFADVRGFTQFTEDAHARAVAHVRSHGLSDAEAEAYIDKEARDTLATVNVYLSLIADTMKDHHGTLDKYIGDCVMSFWGAPVVDEKHALSCVNAAVAVHRALHDLNRDRLAENKRREQENSDRLAAGKPTLPLLPILRVGSAINSGLATVGFMGSATQISNYTVFGREVNIASRLEHLSGSDRILVTHATYLEVRRHAPDTAITFRPLEPVVMRGIQEPVAIYEVPWRLLSGATRTEAPGSRVVRSAGEATKR